MLSLLLILTLQIFYSNAAVVNQNNKLFQSSEKRSDSHLRRSFDPGYAWGNKWEGGGGGGGGARFRMRNPPRRDFRSFNRRKLFRDRSESRQGEILTGSTRIVRIPLQNVTDDDCVCGHEIGTPEFRPWMVKITPTALSNSECDGAVINRKFILSTASCFCIEENRGKLDCLMGTQDQNLHREYLQEHWDNLNRVNIQMGPDSNMVETMSPPENQVRRLILHTGYEYELATYVPLRYDIAVLEMSRDLYTGDGLRSRGQLILQPICLPLTLVTERTNAKFDDMDDFSKDRDQPDFPPSFDSEEFLTSPYHSRSEYRSSYLTWNDHQSSQAVRHKDLNCRTNSYSPDTHAFKRCETGFCLGGKNNPSKTNQACMDYISRNGFPVNKSPLVSRIVFDNPDGTQEYCYPYEYINTTTEYWDQFSYNWCRTQNGKGKFDGGWGWCNENCRRVPPDVEKERISQEVHVDSFDEWGCTDNEEPGEFCTGVKINHPAQKIVTRAGNQYITLDEETAAYNIELIDQIKPLHYDPANTGIINNTLWQHTEPCYGGRGASVWKLHRFHDNTEFFNETDNVTRTNGFDFAVLTGLMSRLPSACMNNTDLDPDQVRWGPKYHSTHTRIVDYIDWINTATRRGQEPSCSQTHVNVTVRSATEKKSTTPGPTTAVSTTTPAGVNGTIIVTKSSWVCVEITTRKLIVTMVPTCIISLDITTPKFNRTMCTWIWVSIIGITPIPVMTCIPLTTCILLDHENSTDILTPSAETECINITSMVTRKLTFPNNFSTVVTVTTCIYLEPNITCYPTTCVPVTNKTNDQTITGLPILPTTTRQTSTRGPRFGPGKRVKRSKQIKTDALDLEDTDNIT